MLSLCKWSLFAFSIDDLNLEEDSISNLISKFSGNFDLQRYRSGIYGGAAAKLHSMIDGHFRVLLLWNMWLQA
ncbi:hypothetical protein ACHQM5_005474 [Ranunculus cassubicifolius]